MSNKVVLAVVLTGFLVLSPVGTAVSVVHGTGSAPASEARVDTVAVDGGDTGNGHQTDRRVSDRVETTDVGNGSHGNHSSGGVQSAEGDDRPGVNRSGRRHVHEALQGPILFRAATSAVSEPAVGEPTTVTVNLTATRTAENVTVSLPDYRWVAGDGDQFDLGQVTAGETYTISTSVTPTAEIARYLAFTARGQTAQGTIEQVVNHDLAVVDRWNASGTLQVSSTTDQAITDTTIDAWGARNVTASTRTTTNTGRVEGCFNYTQADGSGSEPGRQLYVEVRDHDVDWDGTLATGRTNDDGCFSISVNDPQSADLGANNIADVYVRVFARNPAAFTANGATRVQYRARAPNSGSRNLGNGGTVDFGDFVTTTNSAAFQAVDWALDVRRYVESQTGWTRPQVRIQYPQGDWMVSISGDGFERLSMPARDACDGCDWRESTLYHEYGHAMFHSMYEDYRPNWPDKENYHGHVAYSETDDGFAVIEGFAEFIEGEMDRQGYTNRGPSVETNHWFNGTPSDPEGSDGNDLPDRDVGDMDGHRTEGSFASIMYDLSDGAMPGNDDTVDAGFRDVFYTIADNNIQSIDDFLNHWDDGEMEGVVNTSFRYGVEYPDPYEDNDGQSQAAQLGTDTTINASTTDSDTTDWYTVTVPAWTVLNVTVDERGQIRPGDSWLAPDIHTETDGNVGTYVDVPTITWASEVTSPRDRARTYDIRVRANNPTAYELDVDTEPANDYFEDNDDATSATRVSPGQEDDLRVIDGDTDWYAVDVRQGAWLNVSIDDQNSEDLDLRVYEPSGTELAQSTAESDGESVSVRAEESESYRSHHLIRVDGYDGEPVGYSMDVETRAPPDLWAEPNEDLYSGAEVSVPFESDMKITSGDTDVFEFELQQGQVVNVSATFDYADGDIDLYAYDTWETEVDRDIYDRDNASVSINPDRNGTYYVEVGGHPGTINDYNLEITPEISAGTTGDNNNSPRDAILISPGNYDDLAVSGDDRNDYFQVRVDEDQIVRADVVYEHTGQATDLSFTTVGPDPQMTCIYYDNCGSIPTSVSSSDQDNESTTMAVHRDGIVYLQVNNPNVPADRTEYDLRVNLTDDDRFEQNDVRANAADLSYARTENLHYHAEDDYYQFEATAGETVNVTALFNASSARGLDITIEDASGNTVANAESYGDDETVEFTPSTNGTYYIHMYSFADAAISRYELLVEGANLTRRNPQIRFPSEQLRTVTNDVLRTQSLVSTRSLTPNTYTDLSLSAGSSSQYAVQLQAGEQLNTSVVLAGTGGAVNLTVYDSDGNPVGSTGELSRDGSLTFTAEEGGRYFVRAQNERQSESEFSLDVSTDLMLSDGMEFNDNRATATNVSDRSYDGLRIGENDTDYFAVDLESGDELTASAVFDNAAGNLDVRVYGPGGSQLRSSTSTTDDESATIVVRSTGRHYVEVTGASGVTADYELTVDVTVPNNDRFEANDEFGTATATATGTYGNLRLARGDRDRFAVDLQDGQHLRTNLSFSGADLNLLVYGPDQNQRAASLSGTADESLALTANESGTYYVSVAAPPSVAGDYELSMSATAAPTNDQYEVNDAQGTATPLSGGTHENLSIVGGELDVYAVSLTPDQTMTVTATFDHGVGNLDLDVAGPDGEPLGGSTSATDDERVRVTAEASGTHYVVVSGPGGATAPYSLTLESPGTISAGNLTNGSRASTERRETEPTGGVDLRSIEYGASVDGEIDEADPQAPSNRGYHEPITFRGETGEVITATMQSEDDSYLILRGPGGEVVAADDDSAAGLNAQLTAVELPSSGEYTLIATSFWEDRTLRYDLSLERRSSAEGSAEVTGLAGTAIPGETVTIDFTLTNTGAETQALLLYPGVEDLPAGWEIVERNGDGGFWRPSNQVWLYQEIAPDASVTPSLTLSVPADAPTGAERTLSLRAFNGTYNDTETVTIPVREQSLAALVDTDDDGQLDDMEILTAIARWQHGEPVAGTDRTISDTDMLELVARWRDNDGV